LLTRYDGVIAVVLIFGLHLVTQKKIPVKYILLFVCIVLPWFIFAYFYFGSVLPQTFYAKSRLITSTEYVRQYVMGRIGGNILGTVQRYLPFPAFVLPLIGLVYGIKQSAFMRLSCAYAALLLLGYTIIAPEDPWHIYPVMVAALMCLGYGITQVSGLIAGLFRTPNRRRIAKAICIVLLSCPIIFTELSDLVKESRNYEGSFFGARHKVYVKIASWLNANTPPGTTVHTLEPGTIAYFSDCIFYDHWGLVTRRGWGVGWKEAKKELKPDVVVWSDWEREDKYPVPDGYVLKETIEISPYPKIFISEKMDNEK
jgi:hypothetical protein